jgi:non-ribosomal peptide synthetase component E (peptide arylation enzyme)
MIFNESLSEFAKRHPTKAAVITSERSITYGELDRAVHGLARHLADRGPRTADCEAAIVWDCTGTTPWSS